MWRFDGHINNIYSLNLFTQTRLKIYPRRSLPISWIFRFSSIHVLLRNFSTYQSSSTHLFLFLPLSLSLSPVISPKFRIVLLQRIRKNCVRRKKEKARTRRRDESRETRLKKWKRECREYWISKYNESRKHCSSETKFSNTYEYCSSSSDMFAGGHGTATRKQNHRLTQLIGTMSSLYLLLFGFLISNYDIFHTRGGERTIGSSLCSRYLNFSWRKNLGKKLR